MIQDCMGPGANLRSYTDLGSYPIVYIDKGGDTYCGRCATENLKDDAWSEYKPVSYFVHYEGPKEYCVDCNGEIESAYGEGE